MDFVLTVVKKLSSKESVFNITSYVIVCFHNLLK